jgi:hypothetical protein
MRKSRGPATKRTVTPLGTGTRITVDGPKRALKPSTAVFGAGVESELEALFLNRLEHAGLPPGIGQYRFVPGRQYRWDRCWPEQMVAVEVQGGTWSQNGHARPSMIQRDCLKLSIGAALGWRVLPITRDMIENGTAVRLIAQALGAVL